jgi:hypothetical protein
MFCCQIVENSLENGAWTAIEAPSSFNCAVLADRAHHRCILAIYARAIAAEIGLCKGCPSLDESRALQSM